MRTYNPNKKIKIEIHAPTFPADGYTVYEVSNTNRHAITRNADDSDIEDILSVNDFGKFQNDGKYIFVVAASMLSEKFNFIYS